MTDWNRTPAVNPSTAFEPTANSAAFWHTEFLNDRFTEEWTDITTDQMTNANLTVWNHT